ncbi:atrial natriuretic peptide receptor 1-like [Pelobates fuscus]|uniref:atrial natriuretic peptide receptor 1-like n=1 Tax=Pelobates fuscus TaxID=191477 RepID=UPI002FE498D8
MWLAMKSCNLFIFLFHLIGSLLSRFGVTLAWHDLDNTEYDCWPLEKPDDVNMIDCGGLEMSWVHRPPEKAFSGETFDVTYSVSASDEFYHFAVRNRILSQSDAASAKRFCELQECPSNWKDANEENCCVHHANIHSCPLPFMSKGGICGPWIPDDGQIFTHTISTSGKMTQGNWSAKVVLFHVGLTSLIAHIRVGKMQVALEAKTLVLPVEDYPMSRNITGSTISTGNCASYSNTSHITALSSCPAAVNTPRKQFFTHTGRYDGRIVAIKKIQKKSFTVSATIRKEVKQIRELDHPNLCKFIGGCTDVPNVAIITEYCNKGSLNDVLLNEDIPLNWGFRFSFANDIAQGMAYLHQHKMYYPRLKSTNCVIDDRWVCKITDYGLDSYRKFDSCDNSKTHHNLLNEVYLTPEGQTISSPENSTAADMYRYAIILLEIATRSDPFPKEDSEHCCLPLSELIKEKSENGCPCPSEYVDLIRKCRSQNPAHRPTFEQVKKQLHKMNPNKVSPVDVMMTLMEKYSKHLELLVAERTQDLMHEKQKTDQLLYSMLPKQVADDLRQGKTSQAQSYVSASIFFSDIVGFTHLSSTSTPYQVVDFLNKLYTTFDEIIDNYDVYKVETIGDAYMVVSGVPQKNGITHASEIASMALDLVAVCKTFRIPHKPNTQLRIRAGIHSGPVVAGVVGTKMPRYCLFGDTVNTASRMESTSEALKIQCSSSTHDLLKQIGGYVFVCRGSLQVKGKGDMVTYWLEGKTATITKKASTNSSAVIQEKERESFNLIPGVLSTDALSTLF